MAPVHGGIAAQARKLARPLPLRDREWADDRAPGRVSKRRDAKRLMDLARPEGFEPPTPGLGIRCIGVTLLNAIELSARKKPSFPHHLVGRD
jgi:hypothetical protein